MAMDYAGAVRSGALGAARLHQQLHTLAGMQERGGAIDIFGVIARLELPLLFRPLKGLLGAYIREPIPGVLITTERSLSIQRFTAAHELGHFWLKHNPSLDDENMLRRTGDVVPAPNLQETEADAFAVGFLIPRWLIVWHCTRQGWLADRLHEPHTVYQLSLRIGASYEATTWTLQRYQFIAADVGRALRKVHPRQLKAELLRGHRPSDYYGDVWLLSERDADTQIGGSRNDFFVLRLNEHSGGGYLWDFDDLTQSGFVLVQDSRESVDEDGVGGPVIRHVTAALEYGNRGRMVLNERRPWQPSQPIQHISLHYDFTGPEEEGLSRAERRRVLDAA